jgi:glycosyltransferase involved in cell wall biosynthesis
VPAYNEAAFLPSLLDSVAEARRRYDPGGDAVEVIVADNASTDATPRIAADGGCRVVRVERRVIAAARNGGAGAARGEIVGFVDADSLLHAETFRAIDATMRCERVVAGATGVLPDRSSLGIRLTWAIGRMATRVLNIDAGVVFCRRADWEAVGGYRETLRWAEDVRFLYDLKRLGRRTGRGFRRAVGAETVTSTRKFDTHGDWHYVGLMVKAPFLWLFLRRRLDRQLERYFYQPRR